MFIFGLSLHASSNSEPGSVSGSVTVSVVSRRAGGRGSWPHYQPRFNLSGSDTKTTHTPPSHSPGLLSWHYMLHVLWSEVMSLGPGEVMTPAQWLNNDQHLHRCQEVRWGSHQRVTIISFLICQHCAMISDDAPTGYCKSSLWFIGQQFSVALAGLWTNRFIWLWFLWPVTGVNHPSGELLTVPATMAAIIRLCLDIGQIVPSLILTKLLFYSNS